MKIVGVLSDDFFFPFSCFTGILAWITVNFLTGS